MPLTSIVLEYSPDPVSDTSPSFVTVPNSEFMAISYWNGPGDEGGGPEPGGATIRLVNKNRKWEPLFASNVIDTHQQFRLTLNGSQRGLWFITGIQVEYPAGTEYSEVVFECADGMEILAWDNLPSFDPPDAETYEDVVSFDDPWGYWRLGEPEGTRTVPHFRKAKYRGKGKKRRRIRAARRWRTVETAAEVGGVAGPAGTYKELPTLGQRTLILGDTDTSVAFTSAPWVRVPLEADDFKNVRRFSLEAWVSLGATGTSGHVLTGPVGPGSGPIWGLQYSSAAGAWRCFVVTDSGPTIVNADGGTPTVNATTHLVGTCDGSTLRLYVDGVLVASSGVSFSAVPIGASPAVQIGSSVAGGGNPFAGLIDEAAIYEYCLAPERVLAHYQAGAERGFAENTAGVTIAAIVTNARWSTAAVQSTGIMCEPQFTAGRSRLEMIEDLAHSEGPRTMFFFNRTGNPVYLGRDWDSAGAYNTVQAVFGEKSLGETPMYTPRQVYDHETFNEVTATHERGEAVTVAAGTVSDPATPMGKRGRRENTEYTDLLIMEHADVETIAGQVLRMFKDPDNHVEEITVDSVDALTQQLALDVGHRVRVKWSGETGARVDRVANILRYQETLDARSRILTTAYTLSRGFDATDGTWRAGVPGFSEAGATTVAG